MKRQLQQPPPAELWRAALDTRSWTFEAYGGSAREAKRALAQAWRNHCAETDAQDDLIAADLRDLTPYLVRAGQAFRDDTLMADLHETSGFANVDMGAAHNGRIMRRRVFSRKDGSRYIVDKGQQVRVVPLGGNAFYVTDPR